MLHMKYENSGTYNSQEVLRV